MKKLIAIIVLFVGFSQAANAQDPKSKEFDVLAQNDVKLLGKTITLSAQEQEILQDLFVYKHKELSQIRDSAERKNILSENIMKKILGSLSDENATILKNEEDLLKRLSI